MKTIREQVIDFMEHNEQLTKLKSENWYKMEDSLVEFIEKLTSKKDTTYTTTEQIQLADGNYINLVKKEFTIEIQDVVNYCLDLEHDIFITREFACGSYSEKSYCGGYHYEITKGIGTITIVDKNQNKIYKLHTH